MKIAIDVSSAVKRERTGIARYIMGLVRGLAGIDREDTFYLCHRLSRLKKWRYLVSLDQDNFHTRIIQPPFNQVLSRRIDIAHALGARLPEFGRGRRLVTVHDTFSVISDRFAPRRYGEMKKQRYREIAESDAVIVAVSEQTKRDFMEHFGAPEGRCEVIPEGVDDGFAPRPKAEIEAVRKRHGLTGPYLFYVGTLEYRKNVVGMISAYGLLREAGLHVDLALAGGRGWGYEEIEKAIAEHPERQGIRLLGYVSNDELPALYSGAACFLFPSFYEGFGLPVLEAMACGTPVVTSDRSSLPEVAGDAALMVDPDEPAEIAGAVEKVLKEDSTRERLIERGRLRAREFTWEAAARRTLALYRRLYEET